MKYEVTRDFVEFRRRYRAGEVLTDADLECWAAGPAGEAAREITLNVRVRNGSMRDLESLAPPAPTG